jgi:SAM-dependent methyltransferase
MFTNAEAYEHNMGRWSQRLAPLFIEFVGVRDADRVIDVGCGTGSLSLALARVTKRSEIVGDDPSVSFVDYARPRDRSTFKVRSRQCAEDSVSGGPSSVNSPRERVGWLAQRIFTIAAERGTERKGSSSQAR